MSSVSTPHDNDLARDEISTKDKNNACRSTIEKELAAHQKQSKELSETTRNNNGWNADTPKEHENELESLETGEDLNEALHVVERSHLRARGSRTLSIQTNEGIEAVEEGFSDVSDDNDDEICKGHPRRRSHTTQTQYRLGSTKATHNNTFFSRLSGLVGFTTSDEEDDACHCCGFAPNSLVTRYLHWTFRNSFGTVFVTFSLGFFGLTLLFAFILLAAGYQEPKCVNVNGQNFSGYEGGSFYKDFGDAYALSWTTFSTVVSFNLYSDFLYQTIKQISKHFTFTVKIGVRFNFSLYISTSQSPTLQRNFRNLHA